MAPILCKGLVVKFKTGTGANSLRITNYDVGSADFMAVSHTSRELRVDYVRGPDIIITTAIWNWDSVFSYECENMWTPGKPLL